MKYLKYLNYVIRHKWFVMVECFKMGIIWRGIIHDISKLLPSEFFPYADYFYGGKIKNCYDCIFITGSQCSSNYSGIGDGTQAPKCKDFSTFEFDLAWLKHQHRNKHHWQHWLLKKDNGNTVAMEMPTAYVIEMVCDWIGAGKAQGFKSPKDDKFKETREWYFKNRPKMILHHSVIMKVKRILEINL